MDFVQYSRSSVGSVPGGPFCEAGPSRCLGVAGGGRWLRCTGGLGLPPAKGAVAGRGQGRVEGYAPPAIGQKRAYRSTTQISVDRTFAPDGKPSDHSAPFIPETSTPAQSPGSAARCAGDRERGPFSRAPTKVGAGALLSQASRVPAVHVGDLTVGVQFQGVLLNRYGLVTTPRVIECGAESGAP